MRFTSSKTQASPARTSGIISPSSVAPPSSHAPWRSLWSRVYTRWATAPPTAPPTFVIPASVDVNELPKQTPSHVRHYPHLGLREYWQRKRGVLWFVTKRREDGDLQSSPTSSSDGHAEEVEVVPPPQRRSRDRRRITLFRLRSKSQRSTRTSRLQSHESSEIEIAMSSFSLSSSSDDSSDCDDDSDGGSPQDEGVEAKQLRDSYEHAVDDPFLLRYSSWYSIDDEQQPAPSLPEDEGHEENKDEEGDDGGDGHGVSSTLEALYGVHHVDVGAATSTSTSPPGIWV